MKRRKYLGAIAGATGVAGAIYNVNAMAENNSDHPPKGAKRKVSIAGSNAVSSSSPVKFQIRVKDPWITPSSTARLSAITTNTSESKLRIQPAYYKGTSGREGEDGIVVYNTKAEDFDIEGYVPSCFKSTESKNPVPTASFKGKREVSFTQELNIGQILGPGEERAEELVIVDDPTVDGCFLTNTYYFRSKQSFNGNSASWEWSISIDEI